MAFDPFSWAIGFTLTRTAGRLLKKSEARVFADRLRQGVLRWSRSLPEELSDLHPDAVVNRLFEADGRGLGPKRQCLARCFEDETIPQEVTWFEAIRERRQEVLSEFGNDAQEFFRADARTVEPYIRTLAKALHRECIRNETFFQVSTYGILKELSERERQSEPSLAQRLRPADGLGLLCGVPALPERFVPRPEYLGPLKDKLLGANVKAVAVTAAGKRKVGVQGMGGIGKTVLAAAAVREEEIRRVFPDGVFWLTFGQQPNLIARQVQLAKWLGDERAAFQDTQQGKARLEELLRELACVVVVDDVWDVRHVSPFDAVCETSRLLVTTRFRNIVSAIGAEEQRLDVLEDGQALALLAQWAGTSVESFPPEAPPVVKECGGLPLALAMIGAMVQRRPERWEDALSRLRGADIDKIKQDFPDYPYPSLLRAIGVSIDGLDEVKDRYLDFAIFPDDTPIPEAVLETLWGSDGLDKCAVHDVLDILEDRSMLTRDEAGRVALHNLQFDYVRNCAGDRLRVRHRKLLAGYRRCCPNGWHDGPDDGYFFQHLAYHLRESDNTAILRKLLFDYRWLRKRLEVTDANGLIADYDLAGDDSQARLVQRAIRLSSHALADDCSSLASQLLGRLCHQGRTRIRTLLNGLAASERLPWFRPLVETLIPPGSALLRTLVGHENDVTAVVVTRDGRYVVSGSWDTTVRVWELASGRMIHALTGHASGVLALAVTTDSRYAVSGSADETVKVWDLATGRMVWTLAGHEAEVDAVTLTPDGRYIVSRSVDETLKIWDLANGQAVLTFEGHKEVATPDSRYAVSYSDGELKMWDPASAQAVHTLQGHGQVTTPDGRYVVSGSNDGALTVWDSARVRAVPTPANYEGSLGVLWVAPNGRYVVSKDDQSLTIQRVGSHRIVRIPAGDVGLVSAMTLTADGRHMVLGAVDPSAEVDHLGDDSVITLKVWELAGDRPALILAVGADLVTAVTTTPDGRHVITGSIGKTLKVWDLASGQAVRTLVGHRGIVHAVAVTPDGRCVLSGSADGTLRVWDLTTGQVLQTLTGHVDKVDAVAITPDGLHAVSGSEDRTLRIWELASGCTVQTLAGHGGGVLTLTVTSDGRYVISGSADRTLRAWDFKTGKVVASFTADAPIDSCGVITRSLTVMAREVSGRVHFLRLENVKKRRWSST